MLWIQGNLCSEVAEVVAAVEDCYALRKDRITTLLRRTAFLERQVRLKSNWRISATQDLIEETSRKRIDGEGQGPGAGTNRCIL